MNNFEKVIEFNKTFGVTTFDKLQPNIFNTDPPLVDLRLKLIQEEVKELETAIKNKDFIETIDALSDILYVVYGAGSSFGIDLNKTFDIVHRSNMSKVCQTQEEAEQTIKWYENNSEEFNKNNPLQAPIEPKWKIINEKYVVYNATTGKVLKSINYEKVDFAKYFYPEKN